MAGQGGGCKSFHSCTVKVTGEKLHHAVPPSPTTPHFTFVIPPTSSYSSPSSFFIKNNYIITDSLIWDPKRPFSLSLSPQQTNSANRPAARSIRNPAKSAPEVGSPEKPAVALHRSPQSGRATTPLHLHKYHAGSHLPVCPQKVLIPKWDSKRTLLFRCGL